MRVRTTPTEGFLLEMGSIVVAIAGTVSVAQGQTEALPLCAVGWLSSIINVGQIFRFMQRKEEKNFTIALDILKDDTMGEEVKKGALNMIVDCANKGYAPAIELIQKLSAASEQEEE